MKLNPVQWAIVAVKLLVAGIIGMILNVPLALIVIGGFTLVLGDVGAIIGSLICYGLILLIDGAICAIIWKWR
jgi:hypothetical protein